MFYKDGELNINSIGEPYYMKYYNGDYGGPNKALSGGSSWISGMVQEIIKDGVKYLVDANDFTEILARGYVQISQNDNDNFWEIIVDYPSGEQQMYINSEFKPEKSFVLRKTK